MIVRIYGGGQSIASKPYDLEDSYQFSWAHKKIHFPLFSVDRWFVAQQIVQAC
jgi:hypothetical protein